MNNRLMIFLTPLFFACSMFEEQDLKSKKHNIGISCGIQCLTITQNADYGKELKNFLSHQNINEPLLLAQCIGNRTSPNFSEKVAKDILKYGIRVADVREITPYKISAEPCLVLVRGPIMIHPPRCIYEKRPLGAFIFEQNTPLIEDNFGCYNKRNLAFMIDNPKDLLRLSGYTGKIR